MLGYSRYHTFELKSAFNSDKFQLDYPQIVLYILMTIYIFQAKLYIQRTASKLRQLWRHWIFLKRLTENCDRFWAREEISQHLSAFCQCERVSGRIHGVWGGVRVWRTWKDRPPVGLPQVPSQPAVVDAAEDEEADDEDGGTGEEKAGALRVERAAHQELARRTWSRKASMFDPWRASLFGHSSHSGVCFQILSNISRFQLLGSLWPSCTKPFGALPFQTISHRKAGLFLPWKLTAGVKATLTSFRDEQTFHCCVSCRILLQDLHCAYCFSSLLWRDGWVKI